MANRLILQGRALLVESSRIIIPKTSSLQEQSISKQLSFFEKSYRITVYISIIFYGILGISIYAISGLWLGSHDEVFINFSLILIVGWFFNTLITPAYFSNLGSAHLKPNIMAHIIIGLSTFSLGIILGDLYKEIGVIIALSTSLAIGSLFVNIEFFKRNRILTNIKHIHKTLYDLMAISFTLNIINLYAIYNFQNTALISTLFLLLLLITVALLTIKRVYKTNAD
jgi:O-antigen/teichoic acid export membrane protein